MKRYLEPVDMAVAIGVFATVLGGYFFFMAANGTLEAASPQPAAFERSAGLFHPIQAMEWVQPVLGHAIVDNALLERQASVETAQAVTELVRAMAREQSFATVPYGHIERITAHADRMDADHATRVQYVAGQSLVTSTARGVRAGVLSPNQLEGSFNSLVIAMAEATMNGMEDSYRDARDTTLGWAIVGAAQQHMALTSQFQHRLGMAITRVVQVQDRFIDTIGEAQGQLGSVAVASLHAEQIADRFDQLARADFGQPAAFTEPRAWPDIPIGVLIGTSIALVGLFMIGLVLPGGRSEPMPEPEAKPLPYRKTA